MSSLFCSTEAAIHSFSWTYNVVVSAQFIDCADTQLTNLFVKKTGIKAGKKACFSISPTGSDTKFHYIRDVVSVIKLELFINHNWNPIKICWSSKSGHIYNIDDTDIDCGDINFWFDHLDTALYLQQFYPKVKLPFKLSKLSFDLVINRLNIDCLMILKTDTSRSNEADSIVQEIDNFIDDWNLKSEKKNRADGVIHNSKGKWEDSETIVYEIDLGSTGFSFLKQLLTFLSKTGFFKKVEFS